MTKLSNLIARVSYLLGVLAVVAALVTLIPKVPNPIRVTPRGCLVFAVTLFLCAIASHLIAQEQ